MCRLAVLVMLMTSAVAHADGHEVEVRYSVTPASAGHAPSIEATVIGGPTVPLDKYSLTEANRKTSVKLKPSAKREYRQGTETIAIALVVNGQEVWMGNDDIEPRGSTSRYPGALKGLGQALRESPLVDAAPPGSKGVLIMFAEGAQVRVPIGPLANLNEAALGTQKDYSRRIGTDMVQGISLALSELRTVSTARKALIVVSDGNDANNEVAKPKLTALKKQAARDGVKTFAIVLAHPLSATPDIIGTMVRDRQTVSSAADITAALRSILVGLADRYYVTFPGYDDATRTGLTWDGKGHDLVLAIGNETTEPIAVTLAPPWPVASSAAGPRSHGCAGCASSGDAGGVALVLVMLGLVRRRRERPFKRADAEVARSGMRAVQADACGRIA